MHGCLSFDRCSYYIATIEYEGGFATRVQGKFRLGSVRMCGPVVICSTMHSSRHANLSSKTSVLRGTLETVKCLSCSL